MNPWGSGGGGGGTPWGPPPSSSGGNPWGAPVAGRWCVQASDVDKQKEDARKLVDKAKEFLTQDARFEFESRLGGVHNGTAVRFKDKTAAGQRLVAKAATSGTKASLRNEIDYLDRLNFAEHIINVLSISNNPISRLGVDFYITEYMEGGSLQQFMKRTREAGERLPNRLLWRIFLCLAKACVEIAWPPIQHIQLGAPGADDPSNLAHSDLNSENILLGRLDPNIEEHQLVPPLQIIDFGEARHIPDTEAPIMNDFQRTNFDERLGLSQYRPATGRRNRGIDKNIFDIGVLMGLLIMRREFAFPADIRTRLRDPDVVPKTGRRGGLDPGLRLLVQRCCAEDALNRPRLEELLPAAQNGVRTKRPDDYGPQSDEDSDAVIAYNVSKFILNASMS